jgi:hypothetical protein
MADIIKLLEIGEKLEYGSSFICTVKCIDCDVRRAVEESVGCASSRYYPR